MLRPNPAKTTYASITAKIPRMEKPTFDTPNDMEPSVELGRDVYTMSSVNASGHDTDTNVVEKGLPISWDRVPH
jgi:hypothetical protein